ncbi:MAG: ABC transporter permease [Ferrimicrobium sp.]
MVTMTPRAGGSGEKGVLHLGRGFRIVVISIVGIFFLVPIAASARYSFLGNNNTLTVSAYTQLFGTQEFWTTFFLSLKIGLGTVLLSLVVLVPTIVWINLKLPRHRRVFESLSLLPLVIPSIVVTLGVITSFKSLPNIIIGTPVILALEYVVLALPYTYRTFDSAVQALDLKTLVDAGSSLGAGWGRMLRYVLLPNLRSGFLGAAVLAFAFAMGEFAVASLLGFNTLPVFLLQVGQTQASQAVALSLIALLFTWIPLASVMVVFGKRRASKESQVTGSGPLIDGVDLGEELAGGGIRG